MMILELEQGPPGNSILKKKKEKNMKKKKKKKRKQKKKKKVSKNLRWSLLISTEHIFYRKWGV